MEPPVSQQRSNCADHQWMELPGVVASILVNSRLTCRSGQCVCSRMRTCLILVNVTKAQLAEQLAPTLELSKEKAEKTVEAVFAAIVKALKDGEKLDIRGLEILRSKIRLLAKRATQGPGRPSRCQPRKWPCSNPAKSWRKP
jgi:nucleoid DNA-binding protein